MFFPSLHFPVSLWRGHRAHGHRQDSADEPRDPVQELHPAGVMEAEQGAGLGLKAPEGYSARGWRQFRIFFNIFLIGIIWTFLIISTMNIYSGKIYNHRNQSFFKEKGKKDFLMVDFFKLYL